VPLDPVVTTIVATLTPDLAKRVARAADVLGLTHEQLAIEAIRLFARSIAPAPRRDTSTRSPRGSAGKKS
jgi:hypothetical protein